MESQVNKLPIEVQELAHGFVTRRFPEVSRALHAAVPGTIRTWRTRSLEAMPNLDRLSITEFENSIAHILHLLAQAMESEDPARLHQLIEASPKHGLQRFLQNCGPETILTEDRILRSMVVIELQRELGRPPSADEAAALHNLFDVMAAHSLLALLSKRGEEHDRVIESKLSGMHRLADLGTLVAGVAHDASNLLMPLRMRLEHLSGANLTPEERDDFDSIELIVKQFQNSIVNLRWLSVDSAQGSSSSSQPRLQVSLHLEEWVNEITKFHRKMLPPSVRLEIAIAAPLPPVAITSAALSQAVFNLIHNARQAITSTGDGATGHIVVSATARDERTISVTVEDDGPGMSAEVLQRSTEPFFTTRPNGSGLGLSLVRALLDGFGGSLKFLSPPPGKARGTAVVITLPIAETQ